MGNCERNIQPTLHTNKKPMTTNNACENNIEKNEQAATEQIKTQIGGSVDLWYYEKMQAKVQQWKSCAFRKKHKTVIRPVPFQKSTNMYF